MTTLSELRKYNAPYFIEEFHNWILSKGRSEVDGKSMAELEYDFLMDDSVVRTRKIRLSAYHETPEVIEDIIKDSVMAFNVEHTHKGSAERTYIFNCKINRLNQIINRLKELGIDFTSSI